MSYPEITIQGDINLTELIEKIVEDKTEGIGRTANIAGDIMKLEGSDAELSKRINNLRDCVKAFQDALVIKRIENLEKELREIKGLPVKLSAIAQGKVKVKTEQTKAKQFHAKKGEPIKPPDNPTLWTAEVFERLAKASESGLLKPHLYKILKKMGLAKTKQLKICGYIVGRTGTSKEIADACGSDFSYVYTVKDRLAKAQFPKWSEELLK